MAQREYEAFDLTDVAAKGLNYVTSMTDEANDFLPYWYVGIHVAPAFARHVRVDDAELVASWYEAVVALQKILGRDERAQAAQAGFRKHLLDCWGPAGLRYHRDYPWSNTNHASFHEMGWVLAGLNRLCLEEPDNDQARQRAEGLVKGLRALAIQRKIKTFWSGDFPIPETVLEFPADLYLRDGGFVPERCTGRGEESIRNAVLLEPLTTRAIAFGDDVALELAEGLANHMLGLSRYFNWNGEFFGHVHSALWFAIGLLKLGRHMQRAHYVEKAWQIFRYVRSLGSEFGWVPEYAQWFAPGETHCETCCIKDMIEFALTAAEMGYDTWDLIVKYTRNQLSEQQIKDGSFVAVDRDRPDDPRKGHTWKDLDRRVVGGWSGGAEPNSLSLARFRSIAGCCVGTAPVGLWLVWEKIVERKADGVFVHMPFDRETEEVRVEVGYPNRGLMRVAVKQPNDVFVRAYPWMGPHPALRVNGRPAPVVQAQGCFVFAGAQAGDVLEVEHPLQDRESEETVAGRALRLVWRGPDVVRMDPPGLPLRLYQREKGVEKERPAPPAMAGGGAAPAVRMQPTDRK